MADSYFTNNDENVARTITGEQPTTPLVSTDLDSVRAYQWEISLLPWSPKHGRVSGYF